MSSQRSKAFHRNSSLEQLLTEINNDLAPTEHQLVNHFQEITPSQPLVLVMGPLRSGTTLFMQWLAQTGLCAYPSNMLSRFYGAPIVGAKIQLMLTDQRFNFRNELADLLVSPEFNSENGKTQGALSPNEFWYFWRRFLAEPDRDVWSDSELSRTMDTKTLLAELAGMIDVFGKPFAAKGMLFNYNIPFLDSVFEKVLFVQMKRDSVTNVASVLDARKKQLGSESQWYSFKIPEYDSLQNKSPVVQACGQIHYINKAIASGLASVDETRKLTVNYEDFCANPALFYKQLVDKLGLEAVEAYGGPQSFNVTRSEINTSEIERSLKTFEG